MVTQPKGLDHFRTMMLDAVELWQHFYDSDPTQWNAAVKETMASWRLRLINDLADEERQHKKELEKLWGSGCLRGDE